jgi:hypothetical protein
MSDSIPIPSNRRTGNRHLACFPASLERPDGAQRPSLIRDLSESGVLLLVRTTKIAVGDQVKLQLFIAEDAELPSSSTRHSPSMLRTSRLSTSARRDSASLSRVGGELWERRRER